MKITTRKTADLKPYDKNARTHSAEQIKQLAASIKEFGFNVPILIDDKDQIIAGHGRQMAALANKLQDVPCIEIKHLTEAQRRAYIIADNKLAANAGWDNALLAGELSWLKGEGFALDLTGFDQKELDGLLGKAVPLTDEDDVPAVPVTPVAKLGQVWKMGPHRLMCGDSTSAKDVSRLMAGAKADMVWTDPPYNVAIEGTAGKIMNDDMSAAAFRDFLGASFRNYYANMRDGAVIYVAHADTERVNFTEMFLHSGLKLSQVLIWVKQSGTLSRQDFNWRHEPILYGWKEGARHYFAGDFTKTTVIEDDLDLDKMTKPQLLQKVQQLMASIKTTAIHHDRPTKSNLHPTMKPVGLVRDMIENSSTEGQTVLDLFGGSGSTLMACETAGRACNLMELDPKYCDVIVQRWQEFTGKQATREKT